MPSLAFLIRILAKKNHDLPNAKLGYGELLTDQISLNLISMLTLKSIRDGPNLLSQFGLMRHCGADERNLRAKMLHPNETVR